MCSSGNLTNPKFLGPTKTIFIEQNKNVFLIQNSL